MICGFGKYRLLFPSNDDSDGPEHEFGDGSGQVFAVRGTEHDGVFSEEYEVEDRLIGPNAEMAVFSSVDEARSWAKDKQFWAELCLSAAPKLPTMYYAIRGGDNDGIVTDVKAVSVRMTGSSAELEKFSSRKEAEHWIGAGTFFVLKFKSGIVDIVPEAEFITRACGQIGVQCC